ncbi:MAG: Hsp20/alpha crystallin family protein [Candidatus Omnitrophica bacterium]|nr:Hsp20/alpha crystallin family protein [Candidatus Omnitrophota bacterium]
MNAQTPFLLALFLIIPVVAPAGAEESKDQPPQAPVSADPYDEFQAIQVRLQRVFEQTFPRGMQTTPQDLFFPDHPFEPPINMEDRDGKLFISVDLPGLKKDDIELVLEGDVLTLGGTRKMDREERKKEEGWTEYRSERFSGSFRRTLRLPYPVKEDAVQAKYENGVLSIEAARLNRPETEKKRIQVK